MSVIEINTPKKRLEYIFDEIGAGGAYQSCGSAARRKRCLAKKA
jgi:hypothetical protein